MDECAEEGHNQQRGWLAPHQRHLKLDRRAATHDGVRHRGAQLPAARRPIPVEGIVFIERAAGDGDDTIPAAAAQRRPG
jgi:hypothetical protein